MQHPFRSPIPGVPPQLIVSPPPRVRIARNSWQFLESVRIIPRCRWSLRTRTMTGTRHGRRRHGHLLLAATTHGGSRFTRLSSPQTPLPAVRRPLAAPGRRRCGPRQPERKPESDSAADRVEDDGSGRVSRSARRVRRSGGGESGVGSCRPGQATWGSRHGWTQPETAEYGHSTTTAEYGAVRQSAGTHRSQLYTALPESGPWPSGRSVRRRPSPP